MNKVEIEKWVLRILILIGAVWGAGFLAGTWVPTVGYIFLAVSDVMILSHAVFMTIWWMLKTGRIENYSYDSSGWVTVFGKSIAWKDLRVHRLTFSERGGYKKQITIGDYSFSWRDDK